MTRTAARWLAIVALALLPLASVPLVGTRAVGVSGLILVLIAILLMARFAGWHPGRGWLWMTFVPGMAVVGGLIGLTSAASALVTVGGVVPYTERISMGWAALALAGIAAAGGLLAGARPVAGSVVVLTAGLLGAVAINLFYINTYYVLAVPMWLIATVMALAASSGRDRADRRVGR